MDANAIIKKYQLDKKSWTFKGFHGILHTFFPVGQTALKPLLNYYGDSFKIALFFIKKDYVSWYWNEEDMTRLRTDFIERANKNPNFLKQHLKDWQSQLKIFHQAMKKVDKTDLSKLSDQELIDLYQEFYQAYLAEFCQVMAIEDAFSMHADRFIEPRFREILKEKGQENKFSNDYLILMSPVNSSFIEQELKDRLKILKLHLQGKKIEQQLAKHAQKYFWIRNNYAKMQVLDADFFRHELEGMIKLKTQPDEELKRIGEEIPKVKARKKAIIKELKLDKEFLNLIKITEMFAYIQDERKKHVLISNYYQKLFFEEIGQRAGLNLKEMEYTIFPEMAEILLKKRFDKTQLAKRYEHCLCIQTLDDYEILDGKAADEIFETVFAFADKAVAEIKGTCASQGKAKGVVKIILKTHDLVNVDQGDILVTTMTRPEMVVAMEKAAAIITDEGGITCHAAIVSRELGIPCIIGTKIGTKVLKDGDLVEVDAEKGIVRKI